jgi:hypothetical protein
MRTFNRYDLGLTLLALAASALVTACGGEPDPARPTTEADAGSIGLKLVLPTGAAINAVSYAITGPGGFSKTGSLDVSHSKGVSGIIGALPAGNGYSITLSASTADGSTSCAGSGSFDVAAHTTNPVSVTLDCHEGARTGSVAVNGTINLCPVIDGLAANPAEVTVGSALSLMLSAHDSDAAPSALSYKYSASSGSFSSTTSATTSFTCTAPGKVTITAVASDGDVPCDATTSVDVVCSLPGSGSIHQVLTIAAYGDAPYGTTPTDTAETDATPAFIAAVNADPKVTEVIHVGDIHSGKQYCTEAYDRQIFGLWQAFADPLIYTPGDNEWSDCHKAAEGGGTYSASTGTISYVLDSSGNPVDYAKGDPIANLALVRSIFFPTPGVALGGGAKQVLSQAQWFDATHPTDAKYVENVMWLDAGVLFVTINLPGGSNNDADVWYGAPTATTAQTDEIAQRTGADLRWLDAAFAQAAFAGAKGMVIAWQADVWDPEKGASHQAGYEPLVASLASHTVAFGKPVLMLNGDSHVYQTGNPFATTDPNYALHPGYTVPNFHRIVVHGSTVPLEYLRLTVDTNQNAAEGPDAFGPFAWEREIQM